MHLAQVNISCAEPRATADARAGVGPGMSPLHEASRVVVAKGNSTCLGLGVCGMNLEYPIQHISLSLSLSFYIYIICLFALISHLTPPLNESMNQYLSICCAHPLKTSGSLPILSRCRRLGPSARTASRTRKLLPLQTSPTLQPLGRRALGVRSERPKKIDRTGWAPMGTESKRWAACGFGHALLNWAC